MNRMEAAYIEPRNELHDCRRKNWFWDSNCIFDLGLSCYAIVVRLYLARCAGEKRVAWPSLSNIAAHCGISRKTAKKAVDELVERGLLAKEARITELGDYTSNIYTLKDPGQEEAAAGMAGEGGRVPQTLPCNEMPGVGYHRPYLGSDRPYVGSVVHSKNTKLRITSEEDVVVVAPGCGEKGGEDSGCHEAAAEEGRYAGVDLAPPVDEMKKTVIEEEPGGECLGEEITEQNDKAGKINAAFSETTGHPLPPKALDELVQYPLDYVLRKIDLAKEGKEKMNVVGWLLEACREDYKHLPGAKLSRKRKPKPPRSPGTRGGHDKYGELYRLVSTTPN